MPRWSRFRRLFGPEAKADVDAELAFHIEMRMRELINQGVPPDRARALALRRFGDYDSPRQQCVAISERRERHMERTEYLAELRQDAGYALRMRSNHTFTNGRRSSRWASSQASIAGSHLTANGKRRMSSTDRDFSATSLAFYVGR